MFVARAACDLAATGCMGDFDAEELRDAADVVPALVRTRVAAETQPAYEDVLTLLSERKLRRFAPNTPTWAARLARLTDGLRVQFLDCCRAAADGGKKAVESCRGNTALLDSALGLLRAPPLRGGKPTVDSPVIAIVFGVNTSDLEYSLATSKRAYNFNQAAQIAEARPRRAHEPRRPPARQRCL